MSQTQTSALINIAIAGNQQLMRECLAAALKNVPGFHVAGEADDASKLLAILESHKVDIILLDIEISGLGGCSILSKIVKYFSASKTIILTQRSLDATFVGLLEKGAKAVLEKSAVFETLITAIREVHSKGFFLGPKLTDLLVNKHKPDEKNPDLIKKGEFNPLEKEVLVLICNDTVTKEIANQLTVSTRTAERYISALYLKTKTRTPAGLFLFAIQNNLYTISEVGRI